MLRATDAWKGKRKLIFWAGTTNSQNHSFVLYEIRGTLAHDFIRSARTCSLCFFTYIHRVLSCDFARVFDLADKKPQPKNGVNRFALITLCDMNWVDRVDGHSVSYRITLWLWSNCSHHPLKEGSPEALIRRLSPSKFQKPKITLPRLPSRTHLCKKLCSITLIFCSNSSFGEFPIFLQKRWNQNWNWKWSKISYQKHEAIIVALPHKPTG